MGSPLGDTARTYLRTGSLEGTARELFVHANTVRYRLGRILDATDLDLTDTHDAFALRSGPRMLRRFLLDHLDDGAQQVEGLFQGDAPRQLARGVGEDVDGVRVVDGGVS